jgi:BirA family biotin operon repressor/biotin-[acetyl-CoA-carboxylase] ligase
MSVTASPGAGDPLPGDFAAALARHADHPWAGAPVVFFAETTSTNDVALELLARGAPHGTMVVALAQTAGRGRRGRSWTSPAGAGVYMSAVLAEPPDRPWPPSVDRAVVPLVTAVAIAGAIEDVSGLAPEIKWPNDLVIDRGRDPVTGTWARRKLAGILAEGSVAGPRVQSIVVGIGVNLAPTAYPPEVVATSVEAESGRSVAPADVFAACRASLARETGVWLSGRGAEVLERWRARSPSAAGYRVRWGTAEGTIEGLTAGLDQGGALLVDDPNGRRYRVIAGEVEWR